MLRPLGATGAALRKTGWVTWRCFEKLKFGSTPGMRQGVTPGFSTERFI
jgi:hypothetical protein